MTPSIESFLLQMPKVELHVHLEGTFRPATLLSLAQKNSVRLPADDVAGIRLLVARPSVDLKNPDLRIHVFAERDQVTVNIDLAGAPGDNEQALRAAGIDDFVHVRVNNYAFNRALLESMGAKL